MSVKEIDEPFLRSPANVLIKNLQYTVSDPSVSIIWVWNAVR